MSKQWFQRASAEALRRQFDKAFLAHPREGGETYLEHLWFTLTMVSRLAFTAAVLLIHGLVPFTFTRTASKQMERIYAIMRSRIPPARREEIHQDWQI
jgi:hypothetical protein